MPVLAPRLSAVLTSLGVLVLWVAVHRAPLSAGVQDRLDSGLFVLAVAIVAGSGLARVKEVLRQAALASPHVDRDRAPVVRLARFGDFAVHFVVVFWARDYLHQAPARSDVAEAVCRGLAEAGIEVPQLQRATAAAPGGTAKAV